MFGIFGIIPENIANNKSGTLMLAGVSTSPLSPLSLSCRSPVTALKILEFRSCTLSPENFVPFNTVE